MTNAIDIRGLRKSFKGFDALSGIDLAVPEGSVFGFLGPNGAGKTTAIRILTGLARPTAGSAHIFGHDVVRGYAAVSSNVGFLPDVPGYYPWMTAPQFLRLVGRLNGLGGVELEERVASLLDLAGIAGVKGRVGGFSRGMKQRLGVAQALIGAPRLLILDEPTSALDPLGRKAVLDMIAALRGKTTVFFSTHILSDVERVCDTVAILDRGRILAQSPIAQLKAGSGAHRVVLEVGAGARVLERAIAEQHWAEDVERDGETLRCRVVDLELARVRIPKMVAGAELALVRMDTEEPTLEDVFVGLVGGAA